MAKPSPWEGPSNTGGFKEEHAFSLSTFPPNSIPFLNRLKEVLEENQTLAEGRALEETSREKGGWQARALLWILNAQYFGQIANIDMYQEWTELEKAHKAGKF
jgi:hypothetical protein